VRYKGGWVGVVVGVGVDGEGRHGDDVSWFDVQAGGGGDTLFGDDGAVQGAGHEGRVAHRFAQDGVGLDHALDGGLAPLLVSNGHDRLNLRFDVGQDGGHVRRADDVEDGIDRVKVDVWIAAKLIVAMRSDTNFRVLSSGSRDFLAYVIYH
jgi:hypothetical protein